MKLLFTSVGRRVELLSLFRQAAVRCDIPLVIIGGDISDTAPALAFCDRRVTLPRISSPQYVPTLIDICREEGVDALIPTIDTDLAILAASKAEFEAVGTRVIVSAPERIAQCRDKRLTYGLFCEAGLKAPQPFDSVDAYTGGFPAFIKPRDGSSSINSYRADSEAELRELAERVPDYIVQPFVRGTEYTVDVLCDLEGQPVYITPRVRLAVRSGEVQKTEICRDGRIEEEMLRLIALFRPCGPITVQLIRDGEGVDHYIEINPRFGGGAPLSSNAGADSAEALLRILLGESLAYAPDAARAGTRYSRYEQSVCYPPSGPENWDLRGVIFDLDDTLYFERDYVRSGYRAVAAHFGEPAMEEEMWQLFLKNSAAITGALEARGMLDRKDEAVRVYRSHTPDISLREGVAALLAELRRRGIRVGLITDGRPEGQRKKIAALRLEQLVDDIIVTDELGGEIFRKPCDIAYRILQRKWGIPFEQLAYVGDRAEKDFTAPHGLGIRSVQLRCDCSVHPGVRTERPADIAVDTVSELALLLQKGTHGI